MPFIGKKSQIYEGFENFKYCIVCVGKSIQTILYLLRYFKRY